MISYYCSQVNYRTNSMNIYHSFKPLHTTTNVGLNTKTVFQIRIDIYLHAYLHCCFLFIHLHEQLYWLQSNLVLVYNL